MAQPLERKLVSIDVNEFVRTRDALGSAYISLSASIDKAVKAYLDHTNVVLAGDGSLNISYLTQPFNHLTSTAQIAQQALNGVAPHHQNSAAPATPVEEDTKPSKRKRTYKPRDPNAPKRPLTAYFRYLQEQRGPLAQQLAREAGGLPQKPGDLSKQATERWNSLSKELQQPYRDAYKRALLDYEKAVIKYKAAGGQLNNTEGQAAAAAGIDDDEGEDDDDDETSEDEDEDEIKVKAAPPPPPPQSSAKKTPKPAPKQIAPAQTLATPQFSSLNPANDGTVSLADIEKPSAKRKAPAISEAVAGPKKRGRKTNAEKAAAVAAADPPAPAPVAHMATSTEMEPPKKKKKPKLEATAS